MNLANHGRNGDLRMKAADWVRCADRVVGLSTAHLDEARVASLRMTGLGESGHAMRAMPTLATGRSRFPAGMTERRARATTKPIQGSFAALRMTAGTSDGK